MNFRAHDIGPSGQPDSDGQDDSYELHRFAFSLVDFVRPARWDYKMGQAWQQFAAQAVKKKYTLKYVSSIPAALTSVSHNLSLATDVVDELSATTSKLETKLSGIFIDGSPIVALANFILTDQNVSLTIDLRSQEKAISTAILSSLWVRLFFFISE